MPETFANLRHKLASNKAAKLGDFNDREHLRNLLALKLKMQQIGSKVERRKNGTDPLNNPVRLFRNSATEVQKVSIYAF